MFLEEMGRIISELIHTEVLDQMCLLGHLELLENRENGRTERSGTIFAVCLVFTEDGSTPLGEEDGY